MSDLINKLRNSLAHYAKKRRNQKIINFYDDNKIMNKSFSTSLHKLGHLTLNYHQLFDESLCKELVAEAKNNVIHNRLGNYINYEIPLSFLKLTLRSLPLIKLAEEYIGEGCRLDDIYLWSKSPRSQGSFDISEGWHTDDVGRRLKCFISLDCEQNAPTTLYIEGSNLRPYKAKLFSNVLRYFGYISAQKDVAIEHAYANDEVFIFDTNGEHRGNYNSKTGTRFFLVIEFIDWSLCNFQLWTDFPLSFRFLFIALIWSVLFMKSIDSSFIKVCSIYKNICFGWLDFIFGIIFNCWLECLMIIIFCLYLPLMILFKFNNIIKVI
jgi:hypothetical protein